MERFVKNIVLIGFMGSGKSTIARLLADKLDKATIDSDDYISKNANLSIREIFNIHGEKYFRKLEKDFIDKFSKEKDFIIATGGGMPIFNDISTLGNRFYLKADFDRILQRIQKQNDSKRPLFDNIDRAYNLYTERLTIYEKHCDYIIDSNTTEEIIVESILEKLYKES